MGTLHANDTTRICEFGENSNNKLDGRVGWWNQVIKVEALNLNDLISFEAPFLYCVT